jgi:hypothetical protein
MTSNGSQRCRGKRYDTRERQRVNLVGKLSVIEHEAAVVNRVLVPKWVEIRVTEVGVK